MLRPNRVPAEALGQARLFRNAVLAASDEVKVMVMRISLPLIRRLEKTPSLRHQMKVDTIKRWRDCRIPYRVSFKSGYDAKGLRIEEIRLDSVELRFADWHGDYEPGIAITRLRMAVDDRLIFETTPFVILSLHALARWWERSGKKDTASLLEDIVPLVLYEGEEEHVASPSGRGSWVGDARVVTGTMNRSWPVRAVRTFYSSDNMPASLPVRRRKSTPVGWPYSDPVQRVFVNNDGKLLRKPLISAE